MSGCGICGTQGGCRCPAPSLKAAIEGSMVKKLEACQREFPEIAALQAEVANLRAENANFARENHDIVAKWELLGEEAAKLRAEVDGLKNLREKLLKDWSEAATRAAAAELQVDGLQKENINLKETVRGLKERDAVLSHEYLENEKELEAALRLNGEMHAALKAIVDHHFQGHDETNCPDPMMVAAKLALAGKPVDEIKVCSRCGVNLLGKQEREVGMCGHCQSPCPKCPPVAVKRNHEGGGK